MTECQNFVDYARNPLKLICGQVDWAVEGQFMRKSILVAIGVLAMASIGIGGWLWTPTPTPFDSEAALKEAEKFKARIVRDAFGVPHIYGARDQDVSFGLAYAHAEDDWKTIEDVILFSRGALAERDGKSGAITDFLVAALGVDQAVKAQYLTSLSEDTRSLVTAYAAGLNLWCAEVESRCAPGVAPVSPYDVVAGFVSRTPFFYGLDDQLKALFDGDAEIQKEADASRSAFLHLPKEAELGSNAMAVGPTRSDDGHTRLMVNSHQPFTGPVAWYEARVKSDEGWDMIGGLFPGAPLILHGAGPDLGWAFTVNKPDLVDIYKLETDREKNPTKYKYDNGWLDFEKGKTNFRVKLLGRFSLPVRRTLLRSVHGPVFKTPTGYYAVSFAGDRDIRGVEQWYRMNKADSMAVWLDAMRLQAIPSFNVVYGDAEGNIGYFYNAAIPERSRNWEWSRVAPGSEPELVWQGVMPFGTAPTIINPSSGYVVNGNHTPYAASGEADNPKPKDFADHLGIANKTTNRGFRLQELYGADDEISRDEFLTYKWDNSYSKRSKLGELLRKLTNDEELQQDPELSEALALLAGWDLSTSTTSRAAALAIRTGQLVIGQYPAGEPTVDDPAVALKQAITELEAGFGRIDPIWGEVNRLKRGATDLPLDGGPDILRAIYGVGDLSAGSYTAVAGDTYILFADWSPDGALSVDTIHQFGSATLDVASPHYADQAPLFAQEKLRTPPMTLEALLSEATADYAPGNRGDN